MPTNTTKSTLNDVLADLGVDMTNLDNFLSQMNKILSTTSDSVSITQTTRDGETTQVLVPSFGYLNGKVDNLSSMFETLLNANDNVLGVVDQDGNARKFQLQNVATLVTDLEAINAGALTIPTDFRVKPNWFFNSFLNPLLFVSINISAYLNDAVDRFEVKRLIINTDNDDDKITYFDSNYLGKNDINLNNAMVDLASNNITWIEDDEIVDLPVSINQARGTFDVLQIFENTISEIISGTPISSNVKMYKLNTLQYNFIVNNQVTTRFLQINDVLITENGSEYKITNLDKNARTIQVNLTFGNEGIAIGANVLRIKPQPYKVPELQINVGFNERQIIFIRPISSVLDLTTDLFSNGMGIFSNNLTIKLADGSTQTLADYYNSFVSDFGLLFLNYAKEKKVPAALGVAPTAPVLSTNNFKVVQQNAHINSTASTDDLKNQLATQAQLKSQITTYDATITSIKAQLNTNQSLSGTQKNALQNQLTNTTNLKTNAFNQLATISQQITLSLKTNPSFITSSKYVVQGFWEIPTPQQSTYGAQQVVQFKVRYRYLSQTGTTSNSTPIQFTDSSGNQVTGYFSNYTEVLTKARVKTYDATTGTYTWVEEDVADANAVNSNQIAIPISSGESVEISIASISEAGYPDNPLISAYSNAITIPFPSDIQTQEESTLVSQQAFADASQVSFTQQLNSQGLDIHLQSSFTTGDKYYAHAASDISSGFFDSSGNVIDLGAYIQTLTNQINALTQALQTAKATINVTIYDGAGNQIQVTNGQTVQLFAGYYKDQIKTTDGSVVSYNDGQIIDTQYIISISNTSQTPLELISYLMGGTSDPVAESFPASFENTDYNVNRRYDIAPITANDQSQGYFNSIQQKTGFQSSQVKSQFIYLRGKDFALKNLLNDGDNIDKTAGTSTTNPAVYKDNATYNYQGTVVSGSTAPGSKIPYISGKYLPFDPSSSGAGFFTTNPNVWSGYIPDTSNPGSYINNTNPGYLSEFCIHKQHPLLPTLAANYNGSDVRTIMLPTYSSSEIAAGIQKTLPFSHAIHFDTSVQDVNDLFGVPYYAQAQYVTPDSPNINGASNASLMRENAYPIKLSFEQNDSYLIGRYTCGSYLFLLPSSVTAISVDGNHPTLSKKVVNFGNDNAINIPLVYQYRCSDKLGYIGGYRFSSTLSNVKYSKKIGFDIYINGQTPFSFDVQVSSQYTQDTVTSSPIVPNLGKVAIN